MSAIPDSHSDAEHWQGGTPANEDASQGVVDERHAQEAAAVVQLRLTRQERGQLKPIGQLLRHQHLTCSRTGIPVGGECCSHFDRRALQMLSGQQLQLLHECKAHSCRCEPSVGPCDAMVHDTASEEHASANVASRT